VREHDFGNLLQDFRYAVEQQDRTMMDYLMSPPARRRSTA
jgi:hypothetical protein